MERTNSLALNDQFKTFEFGISDLFRISSLRQGENDKSVQRIFARTLRIGLCPGQGCLRIGENSSSRWRGGIRPVDSFGTIF